MATNIYHRKTFLFSGICPCVSVVVYISMYGSRVYVSQGLCNPGGERILPPLPPYCSCIPVRKNLAHVYKILTFFIVIW